jgi:hypothetical protein
MRGKRIKELEAGHKAAYRIVNAEETAQGKRIKELEDSLDHMSRYAAARESKITPLKTELIDANNIAISLREACEYWKLCDVEQKARIKELETEFSAAGWRACIDHIIRPQDACPVCKIETLQAENETLKSFEKRRVYASPARWKELFGYEAKAKQLQWNTGLPTEAGSYLVKIFKWNSNREKYGDERIIVIRHYNVGSDHFLGDESSNPAQGWKELPAL